jgi:hypothetical protein
MPLLPATVTSSYPNPRMSVAYFFSSGWDLVSEELKSALTDSFIRISLSVCV